jgi:hypothetical protein
VILMNWLFVAVLGGNLMTATFDKEGGCLGQKEIMMRDHHVTGQCVNLNPPIASFGGYLVPGTLSTTPSITVPMPGTVYGTQPSITATPGIGGNTSW